jgi:hypothetical protein
MTPTAPGAASPQPGAAPPEPDYGPSLPELLRPRLRALGTRGRILLGLVVVALLALVMVLLVSKEASVESYVQTEADARARGLEPLEFRFDRSSKLKISKPAGAYVMAERTKDGALVARFTVTPFRMQPRPGALASYLPLIATDLERAEARRRDHFRLQFEGRARVNEVEGYQYAFTARLRQEGRPPRQLFGRVVVLPEPYSYEDPETEYPPGRNPSRGLLVTMLATTLDEAPSATRVGDEGILQRPFRSFRYGGS